MLANLFTSGIFPRQLLKVPAIETSSPVPVHRNTAGYLLTGFDGTGICTVLTSSSSHKCCNTYSIRLRLTMITNACMHAHTQTHTWSAPSMSTDCVTDGHADRQRAQYVMRISCCICRMAKPCRWRWRPAACELPVSYPAQQPASPRMPRWPTDMWCATVLDQVQPCSVTWVADRTSSCWPWRCPCNAWVDRTVGVCLMTTVRRRSVWVSGCRPYGRHVQPSKVVLPVS